MRNLEILAAAAATLLVCAPARGQHLWWDLEGQTDAACLYGEITVLATHHAVYYCGANWHPGEPAGGYCGIQHNSQSERRTIFSIWDTAPGLHPKVTEADRQTVFNRFGGEGEGAHTHMAWDWKVGDTFQFFVHKLPSETADATDARYFIFDPKRKTWLASATITSPNGGEKSVATIGGGLNSFLENFGGRDNSVPKLALYRLWVGPTFDRMKCLTKAAGDGTWGVLHDAWFLAEGDPDRLTTLFDKLEGDYGKPTFGGPNEELPPISDKPLPDKLLKDLATLPRAEAPRK
jgi:hypothetical protein